MQGVVRFLVSTHTHTRITARFPGLPRWDGTRKVKPVWILLKQETASGSGISWAICKSACRSRQITTPVGLPHHSVFTGRMPFLPPNQQRQSSERNIFSIYLTANLLTNLPLKICLNRFRFETIMLYVVPLFWPTLYVAAKINWHVCSCMINFIKVPVCA